MIASSVANYAVLALAGKLTAMSGIDAPRYVVLFNMAITLASVLLAMQLKHQKRA